MDTGQPPSDQGENAQKPAIKNVGHEITFPFNFSTFLSVGRGGGLAGDGQERAAVAGPPPGGGPGLDTDQYYAQQYDQYYRYSITSTTPSSMTSITSRVLQYSITALRQEVRPVLQVASCDQLTNLVRTEIQLYLSGSLTEIKTKF